MTKGPAKGTAPIAHSFTVTLGNESRTYKNNKRGQSESLKWITEANKAHQQQPYILLYKEMKKIPCHWSDMPKTRRGRIEMDILKKKLSNTQPPTKLTYSTIYHYD